MKPKNKPAKIREPLKLYRGNLEDAWDYLLDGYDAWFMYEMQLQPELTATLYPSDQSSDEDH